MKQFAAKAIGVLKSKTFRHAIYVGLAAAAVAIANDADSPVIKAIAQLFAALISPGS